MYRDLNKSPGMVLNGTRDIFYTLEKYRKPTLVSKLKKGRALLWKNFFVVESWLTQMLTDLVNNWPIIIDHFSQLAYQL